MPRLAACSISLSEAEHSELEKLLRRRSTSQQLALRAIAIGQRVRDVRAGPDGHLYVLTDAPQGQLIRLD